MTFNKIVSADDASYQLPPLVRDRIVANIVDDSATVKTNLVTNPSFEVDAAGWAAFSGATNARVTSESFSGSASMSVVTSAASQGVFFGSVTVSPSTTYTASLWIKAESGKTASVTISERNSSDVVIGSNTTSTTGTGTWQRVSLNRTLGSTAAILRIVVSNTQAGAHTFYVDAVQLEVGSTASDYFDGSMPIEDGAIYAWTGMPHASTSTKTITTDERSAVAEVAREESAYLIQQSYESGVLSPNYIINGAFDIWQRGTSFTNPAAWTGFTADRWLPGYDGSGATRTISQQAITPGSISGIDLQYFYRYSQTVAGSGGTYNIINNRIEDARTIAGKVVTVSFYAKAAASITLPYIDMEQNFGTGGSAGDVTLITSNAVIGTSWNRYSYTFVLKSVSGKTIGANSFVALRIQMPINTTFTLDITGVQLEEGSTATPFRRNSPNIQAELAACQRYYFRRYASNEFGKLAQGYFISSTVGWVTVEFPVPMRATPLSLEYTGNVANYFQYGGSGSPTGIAMGAWPANNLYCGVGFSVTSATVGTVATLTGGSNANNGPNAYLGFSAEL